MDIHLAISVIKSGASVGGPEELDAALRHVKNSTIGKKAKKQACLDEGVAPSLVSLLMDENVPTHVKLEAMACLGTLCHARDASSLAGIDFIPHLTALLSHRDEKVVSMALYSISRLTRVAGVNLSKLFDPPVLDRLISYIKFKRMENIPTSRFMNCGSMRRCRYSLEIVSGMFSPGIEAKANTACSMLILVILSLIDSVANAPTSIVVAALDALSKIISSPSSRSALTDSCKESICSHVKSMLSYCKSKSVMVRYYSARCLTEICRANIMPSDSEKEVSLPLLVITLKLLSDNSTTSGELSDYPPQSGIMAILFSILDKNVLLHTSATESGIINTILPILSNTNPQDEEEAQAEHPVHADSSLARAPPEKYADVDSLILNALLILSSLCSTKDECRKKIIDAEFLPEIMKKMKHKNNKIRAAACKCARNLTRSTKNLSTAFVKSGIVDPLIRLLHDDDVEVQTTSTATICNIILAFPAAKRHSLITSTLDRLITFTSSPNQRLRVHAVWALKNFAYNAEPKVRITVMQQLPWSRLMFLLNDSYVPVQEQALNLLRNIACGKDEDISQAFLSISADELFKILEDKLKTGSQKAVLHSLYIIVNLSSSILAYKNKLIKNEEILLCIMEYTRHADPQIRIAALWCIINFSWSDDDYGHIVRVSKLCELGFEKRLFEMLFNDQNIDVKDGARTALLNFGHTILNNNVVGSEAEISNQRSDNTFAQESSIT